MVEIPWLSVRRETWIKITPLLIKLVADRKITYPVEVKDDSKRHLLNH
jgi:hypothetical protein